MTFDEIDVPADMVEEANQWRQNLVEAVAEYDEKLLEKFFEIEIVLLRQKCTKLFVRHV